MLKADNNWIVDEDGHNVGVVFPKSRGSVATARGLAQEIVVYLNHKEELRQAAADLTRYIEEQEQPYDPVLMSKLSTLNDIIREL